ncbi:MAG: HAMP domain-containing histidine kinase [Desulfobacterales bacterium]|nr:HAMP domain-containing histidine kinase [Desulfobacterales bacterium]
MSNNSFSTEQLNLIVRMALHDLDVPFAVSSRVFGRMVEGKFDYKNASHVRLVRSSLISLERARRMINDLNAVLSGGRLTASLKLCELREIVDDIVREFSVIADSENQEFKWTCINAGKVLTDVDFVHRIVVNFLLNALYHGNTGKPIFLEVYGDKLKNSKTQGFILKITNSGKLIPIEYLETIFDPGVQLDMHANRKWKGQGLGLAFCKMAADAIGGIVKAENLADGSGVVFTLEVKS